MKAIITRDKRNALDSTINWLMGIKTEVRKPTAKEIEYKKSKKSPYNMFDYTIAIGSSAAVLFTTAIHPDVALANTVYYLSQHRLKKRLDKFNNHTTCEIGDSDVEAVEEDPVEEDAGVIEGEVVGTSPAVSPA